MDFRQGLRKAVASVLPIPPCESGPDNLVVQVPPIRQYDLGDGALVSVDVADLHGHHLPESRIPGELFGACPEWLLYLGAIDPPKPDALTLRLPQVCVTVHSRYSDDTTGCVSRRRSDLRKPSAPRKSNFRSNSVASLSLAVAK